MVKGECGRGTFKFDIQQPSVTYGSADTLDFFSSVNDDTAPLTLVL